MLQFFDVSLDGVWAEVFFLLHIQLLGHSRPILLCVSQEVHKRELLLALRACFLIVAADKVIAVKLKRHIKFGPFLLILLDSCHQGFVPGSEVPALSL